MSLARCCMLLGLLSTCLGLMPMRVYSQIATGVPFTPQGIRSIRGRNICDFQGEFSGRFGVYLNGAKEYSVDYRERDGVVAVFLLSKPKQQCGIVDAFLDLTHLIREGETIEFKCYTDHEGGATSKKWGHVVGLADNHNGLHRFVHARLAWRVDIKQKTFEEIKRKAVVCDTSGYTD